MTRDTVNLLAEMLGESPNMVAVREQIGRLLRQLPDGRRLPPILIQGETGTGKGLLARALHRSSPRAAGPFVDVNCAAIPETLLEAELFGFERGAFTGAQQAKPGLFQAAHRGALFLDEVGLLPVGLQGKLLKVIEERVVRRLGSVRGEPVDVWILTATSEDLPTAMRKGRFQEALYHRLAVVPLSLPPLRDRGQDILRLAEHFLARACADYALPPKTIAPDAQTALLVYRWPGNVRELSNLMERVALLVEAAVVTLETLGLPEAPLAKRHQAVRERAGAAIPLKDAVGSVERDHLIKALHETQWNLSRAAKRLGISRNTLRYRIEKHGLRPEVLSSGLRRVEVPMAPELAPVPSTPGQPVVSASAAGRWEQRHITLLRAAVGVPPDAVSPFEAWGALNVVVDKVGSFGGRIEELSPRGIVAAFGLDPAEDAPSRAALAALAMQKAAERARGGETERIAVGLHVAQFMIGRVGGTTQIDADARRQAWTVLEGLVACAGPDTIVVSEAAAPFLTRRFELVPVRAPAASQGQAYRLAWRHRTVFGLGGRVTRFVGRRDELELLRGRLSVAMRGQGQVVGIAGEAGIGKSRLLYEFRERLTGQPVTYLEGRCLSFGSPIPYLPVLDLVRQHCEIGEADPPEAIKARTFEALRQLSLKGSRQHTLILGVEDLHWSDKTSEEYLASLVESLPGAPILLVCTYRPGYRPPWIEKSYATQMALQPLAPEDSLRVVHAVLQTEQVPDPLAQVILSKAEGNPFFLEELAWIVREHGDLRSPQAVPDTIQGVLMARIDRLPDAPKRLLQTAAILGREVSLRLLGSIWEGPGDIELHLSELKRLEFLYDQSGADEPVSVFKHALTQEVAYESLLAEQRRPLHAQVVEAIERLYPDRLAEQVERLAHHALRGEMWDKTVGYLRQAGAKATAQAAYRESVVLFEQALVALQHLPERCDTRERAIDLRFDLRISLHPLGELGRILDYLREAETLAEQLGDQRRLGRISAYMSNCYWMVGDQEHALTAGQRSLALAAALGDVSLQVMAKYYLGLAYHALGEYRRAVDCLRWNVVSLEGERSRQRSGVGLTSVSSRTWLVLCLAELGEFAEGIVRGEEGVRIAEADDRAYSLMHASFGIGPLYLRKGDLHKAIPMLERGLALCQGTNVAYWFPRGASALGAAYALAGRVAEALPLLEQAVEQGSAMRVMVYHALWIAWLSEVYLLAGCLEEANTLAGMALELSREHKERGNQAWVLRLLGEIAAHREPPQAEQAEAHYRQALVLAEALSMRPLLAHCRLGLGTLYRKIERLAQARTELSTAIELYRGMEMTFWLPQAEAELSRAE